MTTRCNYTFEPRYNFRTQRDRKSIFACHSNWPYQIFVVCPAFILRMLYFINKCKLRCCFIVDQLSIIDWKFRFSLIVRFKKLWRFLHTHQIRRQISKSNDGSNDKSLRLYPIICIYNLYSFWIKIVIKTWILYRYI